MVLHGFGLVWGGSNVGLMKVIADEVQANGGKIIGVSVDHLQNLARENCDELLVAKDISERKKLLISRGDAIVLLVGGTGSLDEITEAVELKKYSLCDKPIVVINTNNFYSGFRTQLQKMKEEGFIKKELDELIYFAETPQEAVKYIENSVAVTNKEN